jgi:hypothetical protein
MLRVDGRRLWNGAEFGGNGPMRSGNDESDGGIEDGEKADGALSTEA